MRLLSYRPWSTVCWLALSIVGCAEAEQPALTFCGDDICGTGGTDGSGGQSTSSGGTTTGGFPAATGGALSTGGSLTNTGGLGNTGGLPTTGGAANTGGNPTNRGGSGGSTGGVSSSGGAASGGKATQLGGSTSTGGSTGGSGGKASTSGGSTSGGKSSTGGVTGGTSTGGKSSTGGASSGGASTGGQAAGGASTGGQATGGDAAGGSGGGTVVELAQGKPSTAKTVQSGNPAGNGNDGVESTRFCAADANVGNWWRVDLGAVRTLTRLEVTWEFARQYGYLVEVSTDDQSYTTAADRSTTTSTAQKQTVPLPVMARYVRITATTLPTSPVTWMSFFEVKIYGM